MQSEVLDVSGWKADEDFPVHPVGSKPKRVLVSPADCAEPLIIANHKYLFKTADGWRKQQIWSELIAFEIAAIVGVDVPRCLIARGADGEVGVLIEFFYGYPGEEISARLIHGSDLLNLFGKKRSSDRPHSVRMNVAVTTVMNKRDTSTWWGRLLAFDALIGNTDRHPENWGVLSRLEGQGSVYSMAPVYDNGTSLAYELLEARLQNLVGSNLEDYLNRGTHHCGWEDGDGGCAPFADLCNRFWIRHPAAREAMESVIVFSTQDVSNVLNQCTALNVEPSFSRERADGVSTLLEARRGILSNALRATQ